MIDSGAGMDAETAARAFEPYFTTKRCQQGSGLGLSIVHEIVMRSGGLVRLASILGTGTTVEVFIPISEQGLATGAKNSSYRADANDISA